LWKPPLWLQKTEFPGIAVVLDFVSLDLVPAAGAVVVLFSWLVAFDCHSPRQSVLLRDFQVAWDLQGIVMLFLLVRFLVVSHQSILAVTFLLRDGIALCWMLVRILVQRRHCSMAVVRIHACLFL
jgi:hypothetical protein